MQRFARWMPILGWLPAYDRSWLTRDALAGATVWALVVPESMAYAGIAGVPVQYGLYAVPLALLGYLLFGTSRQRFVGPSATVASISAAVVGPLVVAGASGSTADVVTLTAVLSLMVGVLYVLGGLARLGFVARFFAKPVLDGFIVGLGIYVAAGQVNKLVGIPKPAGNTVQILVGDLAALPDWHVASTVVGVAALAALFAFARFTPRLPGALIVVIAGILATRLLDLTAREVAVVGTVPTGFAFVAWSGITLERLADLFPGALAVVVVGFAQSVAIAKSYAAREHYAIDASQEMIGYGAANIGAGLLQGITVTGSLSKSAAAEEAGGRSPVQFAVVSALVLLTILFIAGLFADLPEPVLAAIVIHAVAGMMRPTALVRLRRAGMAEFWLALGAVVGVLFVGILAGILVGVLLSFVLLIHQLGHPHIGVLGRERGGTLYRDVASDPDAELVPGVLIYRFEAPLVFANAEVFSDDIVARITAADPPPRSVVLDMETVAGIDSTGAEALRALGSTLEAQGMQLALARTTGTVRDALRRSGVLEAIGEDALWPTIHAAVEAVQGTDG